MGSELMKVTVGDFLIGPGSQLSVPACAAWAGLCFVWLFFSPLDCSHNLEAKTPCSSAWGPGSILVKGTDPQAQLKFVCLI